MNKETLEEAAERLFPAEWDWKEKESFIQGAKWQAERMYSEKEQISKFVTINIESATGQDLGKVSYIPLPNVDYTPKQETLEEAAERFSIDIREENYKDGFIEGAK